MPYLTVTNFSQIKIPAGINTVLLDLDNTCYQYDPCHKAALFQMQKEVEKIIGYSIPDFLSKYKEAQLQVKKRIPTQAASHSRALYAQTLFELLDRKDGPAYAHTLEEIYWDTFLKTMKKKPGLDDFLADCHKNDTTVVVVSDLTTTIQCKKIVVLGIADAIDYLVTSEEVGVEKPDPKPFLLALEKAQSNTKTAVVIGDSLEKDYAGAKALDMSFILLQHEAKTPQTTI